MERRSLLLKNTLVNANTTPHIRGGTEERSMDSPAARLHPFTSRGSLDTDLRLPRKTMQQGRSSPKDQGRGMDSPAARLQASASHVF
eukprot:scaffold272694_cov15-Tisochrysis_lutea.AAC.1